MSHSYPRVVRNPRLPFMIVLVLFGGYGGSAGQAQEPAAQPAGASPAIADTRDDADESELLVIRAGADAFVKAFNEADAGAIAALWTEDCEYIDETGMVFSGREAIEKGYAELFAGNAGAEIRVMIDSLRLLGDNTAIEEGRTIVEPVPPGSPGISKYTAIHIKVDGQWLMASVRDAWIEAPSTYHNLADLEWLIGTWHAEEHGAKNESVCRWVANKSFVQRDYTITRVDGTKTSGVQLIGWNPRGGHLQSWNFSADGGHAVGVWTPHQGGWTAEMRGVTGDGAPTSSVNQLTRLDDNAYVWQSVQRIVGDTALPDTDEIVLKRQTAPR